RVDHHLIPVAQTISAFLHRALFAAAGFAAGGGRAVQVGLTGPSGATLDHRSIGGLVRFGTCAYGLQVLDRFAHTLQLEAQAATLAAVLRKELFNVLLA